MKIFSVFILLLSLFVFAETEPSTENFSASIPTTVNFENRIRPLESFEILLAERLCEKRKCADFSAAEILQNILSGKADSQKIFAVNRATARDILHLPKDRRYFLRSEFDDVRSLLRQYAEREDDRPLTLELIRLNDALNLYDSLQAGMLSQISIPFENLPVSEQRKNRAEAAYYKTNPIFFSWILCIVGFLTAIFCRIQSRVKSRLFLLGIFLQSLFAVSLIGIFIWRGIGEGRIPLTSLYEMILCISLGISLTTIFLAVKMKESILLIGAGMNLLFMLLLRSMFSAGDSVESVSVLLNSPFWLSLHVFTIAAGFCVLIFAAFLAHWQLILRKWKKSPDEKMKNALRILLRVGFALSSLGTILGGFWADVAWGRFWGWDPKENAALLVILWTLFLLHLPRGKMISEKSWEALTAALLLVIGFCLFGVNLLGTGLHSYGYSPKLLTVFVGFSLIDAILIAFLGMPKTKK